MDFDDKLAEAISEEAARRGLKTSATCRYCGEVFTECSVSYILAHRNGCSRKGGKPLLDLSKPSNSG